MSIRTVIVENKTNAVISAKADWQKVLKLRTQLDEIQKYFSEISSEESGSSSIGIKDVLDLGGEGSAKYLNKSEVESQRFEKFENIVSDFIKHGFQDIAPGSSGTFAVEDGKENVYISIMVYGNNKISLPMDNVLVKRNLLMFEGSGKQIQKNVLTIDDYDSMVDFWKHREIEFIAWHNKWGADRDKYGKVECRNIINLLNQQFPDNGYIQEGSLRTLKKHFEERQAAFLGWYERWDLDRDKYGMNIYNEALDKTNKALRQYV